MPLIPGYETYAARLESGRGFANRGASPTLGGKAQRGRDMVHGLYQYRGFIWQRAVADLRHRYAGTNLGVVWNVLHPLALIAVYSVVFTTLMSPKLPGTGGRFAFFLYLCSGLLPWLAFAECVTRGCNAFSDNAAYLKKLPIPEQVFVAQSAASASLGLLISFSLLLVLSLALGYRPSWHWLLLPVPLAAMQVMGFGLGLLLGTLNVFFRDIGQLLTVALQVLIWTVPIVYPLQILQESQHWPWLQHVLRFHPLMPPLLAVRSLFLLHELPSAGVWSGLVIGPAVTLLIASATFRKLRAEIRDLL